MFDKVSYWTDWTAIGMMPPFNGSEQRKYTQNIFKKYSLSSIRNTVLLI